MGCQQSAFSDKYVESVYELSLLKTDTEDLKNQIETFSRNVSQFDDVSEEMYSKLMRNKRDGFEEDHAKPLAKANCLKRKVSLAKKRYQDAYFDLDMSYITKRIIGMGFPASGCETMYRNGRDDVIKFFNKYHKNHTKIFNLCLESNRIYDEQIFQKEGFKTARVPFPDHNPSRIRQIVEVVVSAFLHLVKDPENVIAIHCKAGKGRTGQMICCLLLLTQAAKSTEEAIEIFAKRRTNDHQGLTIASQVRYVGYFEQYLRKHCPDGRFMTFSNKFLNTNSNDSIIALVPRSTRKIKMISIGPISEENEKISLNFIDRLGTILASFNKSSESKCRLEEVCEVKKSKTEQGTIIDLVVDSQKAPEITDDTRLSFKIYGESLKAWFNVGYLKSYPEDLKKDHYNFDQFSKKHLKKSRQFECKNSGSQIQYEEFQSYDFDKWYHKENAAKKLPQSFSIIIAFERV